MTAQEFQIEKNVAMLPKTRGHSCRYPFRQMEIGDSFLVPLTADDDRMREQGRITNAAAYYKPRRFSSRRVEGGIRVWRIADKPA